jgi:hypothetical protein
VLSEIPLAEARAWVKQRAEHAPDDALGLHLLSAEALRIGMTTLKRLAKPPRREESVDLFGKTVVLIRESPDAIEAAKALTKLGIDARKLAHMTPTAVRGEATRRGVSVGVTVDVYEDKGPWKDLKDAHQIEEETDVAPSAEIWDVLHKGDEAEEEEGDERDGLARHDPGGDAEAVAALQPGAEAGPVPG